MDWILPSLLGFILISSSLALDTTNCGGSFKITDAADTGVIKSPNYPSPYPNLAKCVWKLTARDNYSVELTVPSIAGQADVNGTCSDYLEIRDGSPTEALRAQLCNNATPTVITSPSKWLWVKFYSDYETNNTGFTATWKLTYHGYNSQSDPADIAECKSVQFCCPNEECISTAYRCDGVNDCGYVGTGSDEDYWCDYVPIEQKILYAWGLGSGGITCVLLFLLALCLEGYCSCCCPKHKMICVRCTKCLKRLGGPSNRQGNVRRNWPSYMKNPAILKLTGDTEGFKEYEKFEEEKDEKKYEQLRKMKEEEKQREREREEAASRMSSVSEEVAAVTGMDKTGKAKKEKPKSGKPQKKGEVNVAFVDEKSQKKTPTKKLTRQKAFNYEEQPQLIDLEFQDSLTPLPSPDLESKARHESGDKKVTKKGSELARQESGDKKLTKKASEVKAGDKEHLSEGGGAGEKAKAKGTDGDKHPLVDGDKDKKIRTKKVAKK